MDMEEALDMTTRARTGVVVTATHPTLGKLYWECVSEASVGAPDYYSISASVTHALLLDADWRSTSFKYYGDHVSLVLREQASEIRDPEYWGCELKVEFSAGLAALHAKSGQTEEAFLAWLRAAEWADAPGPIRVEHLIDHGYIHEWELHSQTLPTDDLQSA